MIACMIRDCEEAAVYVMDGGSSGEIPLCAKHSPTEEGQR